MEPKHSHYFVDVRGLDCVDFYRLAELYEVSCPAAQHVFKKIMAMGNRGSKDLRRDWQDVLDTARRKLAMLDEDERSAPIPLSMSELVELASKYGLEVAATAATASGAVIYQDMDDDSPRMQAIGQNGNTGEHHARDAVVHAAHCCRVHGCAFGDLDCPVVARQVEPSRNCRKCAEVSA
jgi:hypothetical protein